jgi:hypothetical protein
MTYQWNKLINNNTMRLGLTLHGLEKYSLLRFENFKVNQFYYRNDKIAELKYINNKNKDFIIPCPGYIKNVNYELLTNLNKLNISYKINDIDLWLFDITLKS